MKSFIPASLLLVLLSGCAQEDPEATEDGPKVSTPVARTSPLGQATDLEAQQARRQSNQVPALPPPPHVKDVYLKLKDPNTSFTEKDRAKQMLGKMGEISYPLLFDGLQDGDPNVRLASLEAIYKREMVKHMADTLPRLVELLEDPSPAIRARAAVRLSDFSPPRQFTKGEMDPLSPSAQRMVTGLNGQQVIEKLRAVANNLSENVEVRQAALDSARAIEWAVTGKRKPCEKKIAAGQPVQLE